MIITVHKLEYHLHLQLEDYLVDSLETHSRRRSWYYEAWHAKVMRDTVSMFQHCYHVVHYGDIVDDDMCHYIYLCAWVYRR